KKHLIIVESPSKARTIGKFLGSRYKVIASAGHIRDLPKSRMGIDFGNLYEPEYINVRDKGDVIKAIKKEAAAADKIYIATDPDREGEAIAWHICYILGIKPEEANRIEFHEITKAGVKSGIQKSRPINMDLVDAQQGRRVMDRVVGYSISPVLWKKVQRGLSAGRVQSSALKMICDREKQIEEFDPKEYWILSAKLSKQGLSASAEKKASFVAKLAEYKGEKIDLNNKEESDAVLKALDNAEYKVSCIEEKQRKKNPFAPYTTSTLQQDASVKLGFASRRTMSVAQKLYEGCEIKGKGTIGLVSYIRTDSVRISEEADAACRQYIENTFGKDMVESHVYSNKKKGTQDAHEAIRPTDVNITPESIESSLAADEFKLYKLIWSRFVASRMKSAVYDTVSVNITASDYVFKASGSSLVFDGYLKVYSDDKNEKQKSLPPLEKDEVLKLVKLESEQKFTEPPARFTEASLIKELEENGIGRPSTYAPIVSGLTDRKYVKKSGQSLMPTALGNKVIYNIMVPYFKEVVDAGFTAKMEDDLDRVEQGEYPWRNVVDECYKGYLKDEIDSAMKELEREEQEPVLTGETCPECGKPLAIKQSRFGEFIACTGYPECKYTKPIIKTVGVKCPQCGNDIIVRRSKKGKLFYGCMGYPNCNQVFWDKPVDEKCPKCGSLLTQKGKKLVCSNAECKFSKAAE
ncbi:MAG: type I DNA topoisomerase, partial [Firmicutes bacterium]|nr:type I DNA topoisomerase [Bacillota bacterium]